VTELRVNSKGLYLILVLVEKATYQRQLFGGATLWQCHQRRQEVFPLEEGTSKNIN
jgi:hypothetical protein